MTQNNTTKPTLLIRSQYLFMQNNQLLSNLRRMNIYNDEPQFYHYFCSFKKGNNYSNGTGSSYDKNLAINKSIGEALERYCLFEPDTTKFIKTSYNKLSNKAVNPFSFSPFSQKQDFIHTEPRFHFSENTQFSWIKGESLLSSKKIFIPAQLIYLLNLNKIREPIIQFPLSTGSAGGSNHREAIYRGICEVLERDAFMVNYLCRLEGQNLLDFKSSLLQYLIKKTERYLLKVYFVDLFTDVPVHCIACILIDESNIGPAVTVGLSSDVNPEQASISALMEAVRIRTIVRDRAYEGITYDRIKNLGTKITTTSERGAYWSDKSMIKKISFLIKGKKTVIPVQKQNDSYYCLDKLACWFKKRARQIYWVDVTNKAIRKTEVKVVKVIIPDCVPLYLNEKYPYWGIKRIYDLSLRFAFKKRPMSINSLYKVPHPFL